MRGCRHSNAHHLSRELSCRVRRVPELSAVAEEPQPAKRETRCRQRRPDCRCWCNATASRPALPWRPAYPGSHQTRAFAQSGRRPAPRHKQGRRQSPSHASSPVAGGLSGAARASPASRPTSHPGCADHTTPGWSRLPDGRLLLRQELHKLWTAAGSLLVRTKTRRLAPAAAGCRQLCSVSSWAAAMLAINATPRLSRLQKSRWLPRSRRSSGRNRPCFCCRCRSRRSPLGGVTARSARHCSLRSV